MIYAPVLIPTLNRVEHLKRCITSLQNNLWAKFTPLIISVDYPPNPKCVDGYNMVCEYLRGGLTGFGSVEIIYQKENLGALGNGKFLLNYANKHFERYIWTEDDNEMSPNFIEFINKGLEVFNEDDSVIAVCAGAPRRYEDSDNNNNNVMLSHNFGAYGYGGWFNKHKKYKEEITRKNFLAIVRKSKNIFKLYQYDYNLVFALQHAIYRDMALYCLPDGEVPVIDMTIKIYAVLNDKYVVCPKVPKVRNWGYDGSGANCPAVAGKDPNAIVIDQRNEFSYCYKKPMEITKPAIKRSLESELRVLVAFVKLKMWLLFKGK